jgi:hypothetical protein
MKGLRASAKTRPSFPELVRVAGGPARRWRLTKRGEQDLDTPAAAQVWRLFTTKWTRINWVVA